MEFKQIEYKIEGKRLKSKKQTLLYLWNEIFWINKMVYSLKINMLLYPFLRINVRGEFDCRCHQNYFWNKKMFRRRAGQLLFIIIAEYVTNNATSSCFLLLHQSCINSRYKKCLMSGQLKYSEASLLLLLLWYINRERNQNK